VKFRIVYAILASIALTGSLCLSPAWSEEPSNLKYIPANDPEMAAAAAQAYAGLDGFLAKLADPPAGTEKYSVKIGIIDQGDGFALTGRKPLENVEYVWLGNVQATSDGLKGTIGNQLTIVKNVYAGQEITLTKDDVFDWMYVEDGKIVGNATACPLIRRGPKEELEYYRTTYGLEC
jgi:uncharacterized protein YegJ (DUF2314 family)